MFDWHFSYDDFVDSFLAIDYDVDDVVAKGKIDLLPVAAVVLPMMWDTMVWMDNLILNLCPYP